MLIHLSHSFKVAWKWSYFFWISNFLHPSQTTQKEAGYQAIPLPKWQKISLSWWNLILLHNLIGIYKTGYNNHVALFPVVEIILDERISLLWLLSHNFGRIRFLCSFSQFLIMEAKWKSCLCSSLFLSQRLNTSKINETQNKEAMEPFQMNFIAQGRLIIFAILGKFSLCINSGEIQVLLQSNL